MKIIDLRLNVLPTSITRLSDVIIYCVTLHASTSTVGRYARGFFAHDYHNYYNNTKLWRVRVKNSLLALIVKTS